VTHGAPARATTRRIRARRIRVAGLLAVIAAIGAALGYGLPASSSSPSTAASPRELRPGDHRGAREEPPGIANLDPALLGALRRAATDAAHEGLELVVDSGWRSPQHQERLLHEAVATYGSVEEAARWVATPETSAHVSGDAVDVGPADARAWLSEHGAGHGLCQVYGNEPWHFELRPEAVDRGCPPMYPDPTHDPRMRR
jgi:LAS superfamily LD-carboxypeptidase LdcB